MNCPNCGLPTNGSKFCINCGKDLTAPTVPVQPVNNISVNNLDIDMNMYDATMQMPVVNQQPAQQTFQQPIAQPVQQPVYQQPTAPVYHETQASSGNLNFIAYFISMLPNPVETYKEEESKLNNSKNAAILAAIMTVAMTIIALIQNMIAVVRVPKYSFLNGLTYEWNFELLKEVEYIKVIGQSLLIYAGIILAITVAFYVVCLIFKKQLNFFKSLAISATSLLPYALGSMLLSPLLTLIWAPLGVVFSAVASIYTLIMLYELINLEINVEGSKKVFINLLVFSILIIAGYYLLMNDSASADDYSGLLNMFK